MLSEYYSMHKCPTWYVNSADLSEFGHTSTTVWTLLARCGQTDKLDIELMLVTCPEGTMVVDFHRDCMYSGLTGRNLDIDVVWCLAGRVLAQLAVWTLFLTGSTQLVLIGVRLWRRIRGTTVKMSGHQGTAGSFRHSMTP